MAGTAKVAEIQEFLQTSRVFVFIIKMLIKKNIKITKYNGNIAPFTLNNTGLELHKFV